MEESSGPVGTMPIFVKGHCGGKNFHTSQLGCPMCIVHCITMCIQNETWMMSHSIFLGYAHNVTLECGNKEFEVY